MEGRTNQDDETHQLNGLAADSINGSSSDPVSGNGTSKDNDQVSDSGIHELFIDGWTTCIADCGQDDWGIQRETVVSTFRR